MLLFQTFGRSVDHHSNELKEGSLQRQGICLDPSPYLVNTMQACLITASKLREEKFSQTMLAHIVVGSE